MSTTRASLPALDVSGDNPALIACDREGPAGLPGLPELRAPNAAWKPGWA